MGVVDMVEKRFRKVLGFIQDNTCEGGDLDGLMDLTEIEDMLNELSEENNKLKETNRQLREINKEIGDDLYNCRLNKNIISKKLKLWQDTLAEYDIYTIKDFAESFELDAKTSKEKDEKIKKLQEEKDKLKELIKENVFGRYREGSLRDLEFKATAYDDIVKLEMSNESEPKVIVICIQGKKENVKSFCRMFIPFGVCYEIKEIIE